MMHESECCARGAQWSSLLGRVVASCACLPAPMPAPMPDCPAAPLPACRAAECGVGGGRRPGARHLPRGQAAHRAPHRQRHTAGVWVGGSGVAGWVRLCVTWAGVREEGVEGDSSPRSAPPASPASQPSPGASTSPAGRGVRPGRARRLGGGLPRRQLGGSHHPERGHHRHGVLPGGDLRPRAGLPGGGPDVCVCGVCVRLVCGCGVRGSSGIRDRQQGAAWCVALCPQHPPIPPITRTCAAAPPPPTPHTLPLRPHACCPPPPPPLPTPCAGGQPGGSHLHHQRQRARQRYRAVHRQRRRRAPLPAGRGCGHGEGLGGGGTHVHAYVCERVGWVGGWGVQCRGSSEAGALVGSAVCSCVLRLSPQPRLAAWPTRRPPGCRWASTSPSPCPSPTSASRVRRRRHAVHAPRGRRLLAWLELPPPGCAPCRQPREKARCHLPRLASGASCRLARLLLWRPADVWQDGGAVLHTRQDGDAELEGFGCAGRHPWAGGRGGQHTRQALRRRACARPAAAWPLLVA